MSPHQENMFQVISADDMEAISRALVERGIYPEENKNDRTKIKILEDDSMEEIIHDIDVLRASDA